MESSYIQAHLESSSIQGTVTLFCTDSPNYQSIATYSNYISQPQTYYNAIINDATFPNNHYFNQTADFSTTSTTDLFINFGTAELNPGDWALTARWFYSWIVANDSKGWIGFSNVVKNFYNPYVNTNDYGNIPAQLFTIESYPSQVQPNGDVNISFQFAGGPDSDTNAHITQLVIFKAVLMYTDSNGVSHDLSTAYIDPTENVTDGIFMLSFPIQWTDGSYSMTINFFFTEPNYNPLWDTNDIYLSQTNSISITVFSSRPYLIYIGIGFMAVCVLTLFLTKRETNSVYMRSLAKLRQFDLQAANPTETAESLPEATGKVESAVKPAKSKTKKSPNETPSTAGGQE